ncbi:MAG TPA: NUDIX hydrolase [Galbitalea sp.]|jgi:ADP-ribose pyrophosphatase|nr:NUDIX hydrolase [Galbitalea sp.]
MPELVDEPFDPTILSSTVAFDGRVWDVRRDELEYNGHAVARDYVDHPGAAAILARNDSGEVLLIQQYRHPIRMRDWEIPAGLLDVKGEDALAAAKRELEEEVDLVAGRWALLGTIFTSPGGSNELIRVFEASELTSASVAFDRTDEEADIAIQWVPLQEAVAGVLAGRLRNSILAFAVLAAHARG